MVQDESPIVDREGRLSFEQKLIALEAIYILSNRMSLLRKIPKANLGKTRRVLVVSMLLKPLRVI